VQGKTPLDLVRSPVHMSREGSSAIIELLQQGVPPSSTPQYTDTAPPTTQRCTAIFTTSHTYEEHSTYWQVWRHTAPHTGNSHATLLRFIWRLQNQIH